MQSPQPSQRLAWNCRVLKHLPTVCPLTPDLRHQLSPGQLWIGDELGLDRGEIGASEDQLPHNAGIDEIVNRGDTNQLSVLKDDTPVDPIGLDTALFDLDPTAGTAASDGNRLLSEETVGVERHGARKRHKACVAGHA